MIAYHNDADFYGNSRKLIVGAEGFQEGRIYRDSVHLPTIGYGSALVVKDKVNGVTKYTRNQTVVDDLAVVGLPLTTMQSEQLNDIVKKLNDGKFSEADTLTMALDASVRDITESEALTLYQRAFGRALVAVENRFKALLGDADGARLYTQMIGSTELIAIASLGYNNPGTLIGNGLVNALWHEDRAEAWFQIRYGSNGGDSQSPGIAKRRYAEAEKFGLYDNPAAPSPDEAKQVYRMFTLHRTAIETYEKKYGIDFEGNPGSARINGMVPLGAANIDYGLSGTDAVDAIHDALAPARDAIFSWLQSENFDGMSGLSASDFAPTSLYLDSNRKGAGDPLDPNHSAFLNAVVKDAQGNEIACRDLLVGEGGIDYLKGGKGDDVLLGGDGNDVYLFRAGDGADRIVDREGWFLRENKSLTAGTRIVVKDLQWQSADGSVTYTKSGTDLVVAFTGGTDSITIKNFDFTSALSDKPATETSFGIKLAVPPRIALVLGADRSHNPARQIGDGGQATAALNENGTRTVTAFVSEAADYARSFKLAASDASHLKLSTGAEMLDFSSGEVIITLAANETAVSFTLVESGDVDADATVDLTATLIDPNAPTGGEPIESKLTINLDATIEADPGNRIAVQSTANHGDYLGATGPAPGIEEPVADGSSPVDFAGGDLNDYINRAHAADKVSAGAGNDWIGTAGNLFGDVPQDVAAGDGDDIVGNAGSGGTLRGEGGADLIDAAHANYFDWQGDGGAFNNAELWRALGGQLHTTIEAGTLTVTRGDVVAVQLDNGSWSQQADGSLALDVRPEFVAGSGSFEGKSDPDNRHGYQDTVYQWNYHADTHVLDIAYQAGGTDHTDHYQIAARRVETTADAAGTPILILDGGAGDDALIANDAGSEIVGGDGADLIQGGKGDDSVFGDAGPADTSSSAPGADQIVLGAGNDYADAGQGDDVLIANDKTWRMAA